METIESEIEQPAHLDEQWARRFRLIISGADIADSLSGEKENREAQKELFLSGDVVNPEFTYGNIDLPNLEQEDVELSAFKEEVISSKNPNPDDEKFDVIKQAYHWRINERLAQIRMLKAASEGDSKRFSKYSYFVYGNPNQEVFDGCAQRVTERFGDMVSSDDQDIADAAQRLIPVIVPHAESGSFKPNTETIKKVKNYSNSIYKLLGIDKPEMGKTYSAEEITERFNAFLISMEADGWEAVVVDTGSTGINTNQQIEKVEVPGSREVSSLKQKKLEAHELDTHVKNRLNGEKSELALLGWPGLDRYEGAEEGVATLKEQGFNKDFSDFAGIEGFLAVSFAKGTDGTPRDFRQVFELMRDYFYLMHRSKDTTHEEALAKAVEASWKRCVRTFRGTDCKTPGACYTKDMLYREGNIHAWDLVGKDDDAFLKFSMGKWDPSNERHVWILSQLGITDSNLEEVGK